MIGFDANVLVRLIVADDKPQTEKAERFVERHCSAGTPGFINCVVLAEVAWVLESVYGFRRDDVARAIEQLLITPEFLLEDRACVNAALDGFKKSSTGFTDLLIGEINRARGCEATATFDRKTAKIDGFTLVH